MAYVVRMPEIVEVDGLEVAVEVTDKGVVTAVRRINTGKSADTLIATFDLEAEAWVHVPEWLTERAKGAIQRTARAMFQPPPNA